MLFNSFIFVGFFLVVYSAYRLLPFRAQNYMLLVTSYIFYGFWDWRFLFLIWFSSTLDFFVAQRLDSSSTAKARKGWLAISVVVNLGILGVFKYYGFFAESLAEMLRLIGYDPSWNILHIVLPVGISFYTFQTMSYTVDVYRGQMKPTRNYPNYLLFVSFFPQLVAGPIERAVHLLGQVERPRTITRNCIREGAWLILLGYYKKVVMADNLAPFVNEVFDSPDSVSGLGVLAGLLAFAFQIYGDFSGYSDIARGVSRLMGFDLMVNFRMPYFAVSASDFWRRWHISLSTWLRDYLYIALGGSRRGTILTYRNLLLTMLLGGLWHGAAWHFVMWGAFHGILLVAYRLADPVISRIINSGKAGKYFAMTVFFGFTLIGWLFFRVGHLQDVTLLLGNMIFDWTWSGKLALATLLLFAGPLVALEIFQEKSDNLLIIKQWPMAVRYGIYAFMVFTIIVAGSMDNYAFIYFQF